MPILEQDIQLLASQVMADVPEGGGAATGTVIVDGVSNNMFPDVSELDHVYGNVSLRKVFVGISTADTDTYLGANMIVMTPPANPDVSAVMFSTADDFDTRSAAASQIEAYLNIGPSYPGYLFGNHIAGQSSILLLQRSDVPLPVSGATLVLVKSSGSADEHRQYLRIIDVAAADRTFQVPGTTDGSTFARTQVTLSLSSTLDDDYPGFDAQYYDAAIDYSKGSKVYDTVVADAARYYGVVPLTEAATTGDFVVQGDGIFNQLVPSSRTEVAVTDARMNQQTAAVTSAGTAVTQTFALLFDSNHPLFVGGSIVPGSLTVSVGAVSITDKGGKLLDASNTAVGTVDYANGLLSLSSSVFGSSATPKTVTFTAASVVETVGESIGLDVTAATRRLTWVVTLDPAPAAGTLQVSYLSGGVWYVLSDDSSGALRGTDSSFGAGTLNATTGTVNVTLGALPDSPSQIILTWAPIAASSPAQIAYATPAIAIGYNLGAPFAPASLTVTWNDGTARTVSDTGTGLLAGDGVGSATYWDGEITLQPTALPPPGTLIHLTGTNPTKNTFSVLAFTDSGGTWHGSLGAAAAAKTVQLTVYGEYVVRVYPGDDALRMLAMSFTDDGAGNLRFRDDSGVYVSVGTIDYGTGGFTLSHTASIQSLQDTFDMVYPLGTGTGYVRLTGHALRTVTLTILNGYDHAFAAFPPLGTSEAAMGSYGGATTAPLSQDNPLTSLTLQIAIPTGKALAPGATFGIGSARYALKADFTVQRDALPSTGVGTAAGTWTTGGTINVTSWPAGAAATVLDFAGVISSPIATANTSFLADAVTFRTASAPVATEGFQVSGTTNGSAFSAMADSAGKIAGTGVYGTIDYATGVVQLRFGSPTSTPVGYGVTDISQFGISGVTRVTSEPAQMDSLRYNAVVYSYLPLDAAILGLDPVRLPSDGRVPIFRKGSVVVVHNTARSDAQTVTNGQVVNLGRTRISRLRVIGHDGATITTGYTDDLDVGTVTMTDVSTWRQPVVFENRIEDMALVSDVQISGAIRLSRPISHTYPAGVSYVSSALLMGNMSARVSTLFEQSTWTNVWSDTLIGSAPTARYDDINQPLVVRNDSAVTERWALIFSNSNSFSIVAEHLGVIGTGSTSQDCAPLNPHTGFPYFSLPAAGFGTGWEAGNVIRLDTVGAQQHVWIARVVQQGSTTVADDSFAVLIRGDVNA